MDTLHNNVPAIRYSCYFTRSREGEQFVPEHALSFITSGTSVMTDENGSTVFSGGDLYFARRNSLLKFVKNVGADGEYRSVSIFFTQEMLKDISLKHGYKTAGKGSTNAFQQLDGQSVLANYMETLRQYEALFTKPGSEKLLALKQEEAVLLLLQLYPALANVLFDFSEPGKIDLEAFMKKNYHFNVSLERFAYLTGRSLSTFKRDFEKAFSLPPSRWLLQRRLQEAYYLIREKGRAISDVYTDLGFEDLSHFSFAFKKQFGVPPSQVHGL